MEPFHGHNWALPSVKGCSTIEVWNNLSGSFGLSIPPTFFFSFSGLKCDQIAAWLWMKNIILTWHSSKCFGENAHIQTHLLMSDSRCEKRKKKNLWGFFFLKLETHLKTLLCFVFVSFDLFCLGQLWLLLYVATIDTKHLQYICWDWKNYGMHLYLLYN